ncbi:hypothetical protein ACLB2K_066485 [Fragaria x ananassa]
MNRYMKDTLLFSRVRLIELVLQLDKSNGCLRNKVVKEDFRSNNSSHVLSTGLRKLEKHASTLYTDNVFQLICVEIDRVGELIKSEIMHLNTCRVYIMSSYNNDEENECTTTYYHRSSDPRLVCSCQLFEHEGIPCSHLFNVMKHERMREIPRSLILKRWTKEAKSDVHSTVPKDNTPSESLQSARHGDLTYLGSKISYLASQTEEGTTILKKELNKLEPILAEVLKQQKDMSDISDPCNNLLRDPIRVRSKGRQFKKAAALKWNTIDPSQKAQYYVSTSTHSDAIPSVGKDKSKDSRFMATRCSPKRFMDIVSNFSKDQIAAEDLVDSSCHILSDDNPEATPFKTKAQERNSKKVLVKNDVSSNDISPMNLRGTMERKPSHKISSPYVKLDKLQVMGNKLDILTIKLMEDRPRKLQKIGLFIGCCNLYDDDKYLIAFVFLEMDEDEVPFIVFETDYHHLDRSGMKCLQPRELVTSSVIDASLSLLRDEESSTWYYTTYFSEKTITAVKNKDDLSEFASKARKKFKCVLQYTKGLKMQKRYSSPS